MISGNGGDKLKISFRGNNTPEVDEEVAKEYDIMK